MEKTGLPTINIDIDGIFEVAAKGLKRCYSFTAIAQNKIDGKNLTQEDLIPKDCQFVPNSSKKIPDTELPKIADAFLHWSYNNSLRELIESFDAFMLELYWKVLWLKDGKTISIEKINTEIRDEKKKFKRLNFPEKIKCLSTYVKITEDEWKFIGALQDVRNCVSHKRGIVYRDNYRDEIKIKIPRLQSLKKDDSDEDWVAITFPFQNPSGKEFDLGVRFVYEEKTIKEYEVINFTPSEITAICFFLDLILNRIKSSFIDYCRSKDLILHPKERPQDLKK